jgi:fatty acid synthase subunit alpha
MLSTGTIPGNRNADNIDENLAVSDLLVFPNRTVQAPSADGIKAFSVMSFGFGQKGAQVIGVHPRYLFATISASEFASYSAKVRSRRQKAYRYFQDGFYGNKLVQIKENAPYRDEDKGRFLVNADARV